jgi:hypothetical protein
MRRGYRLAVRAGDSPDRSRREGPARLEPPHLASPGVAPKAILRPRQRTSSVTASHCAAAEADSSVDRFIAERGHASRRARARITPSARTHRHAGREWAAQPRAPDIDTARGAAPRCRELDHALTTAITGRSS